MPHVSPELPDRPSRAAFRRGLATVLADAVASHGPFRIAHRRASDRSSSYPADVVRVRFADGSQEDLFCKYGHGVDLVPPTPHRGLAYEADVYEQVLARVPLAAPACRGRFTDDETGDPALVMRLYRDALSAAQADDPAAIDGAVGWIAALHAWGETRAADEPLQFLARYDRSWYESWLDHTIALAAPLAAEHSWLADVAAAYRSAIPTLLAAPPTVIHGEFTTRNTLWVEGRVLPIDWETAAIAAGEIDLAVFTYDWHPDDVAEMVAAYVRHRWAGAAPHDFVARFRAARLYVVFHWLFGSHRPVGEERLRCHLEGIRDEAAALGIFA